MKKEVEIGWLFDNYHKKTRMKSIVRDSFIYLYN